MTVKVGQVYSIVNEQEFRKIFSIPYASLSHFFGDLEEEVKVFSIDKWEQYPIQLVFPTGSSRKCTVTELLSFAKLKEENAVSNINVNITYVITGWDDVHKTSHTLYAGYDESLGEQVVNNSVYEDFEKEVWYNGDIVQVYSKPRIESQWYLDKDKIKHTLDEALIISSQLINHLNKLNDIKGLVNVPRDNKEIQDKLRDITNNVNTIKHIVEDL